MFTENAPPSEQRFFQQNCFSITAEQQQYSKELLEFVFVVITVYQGISLPRRHFLTCEHFFPLFRQC